MSHVRLTISIVLLVVFASCHNVNGRPSSEDNTALDNDAPTKDSDSAENEEITTEAAVTNTPEDTTELDPNAAYIAELMKLEKDNLSILPPIILLDFTNGTNSTSDEKSKRTVNSNLGYGFDRNTLFDGKTNYYFAGGKTGTTVSIEESISPFLPKTIIEHVKPITEQSQEGATSNGNQNQPVAAAYTFSNVQIQQSGSPNVRYSSSQPVFGQRTKLQKTNTSFQRYRTTTLATPSDSHVTSRPEYQSTFSSAFDRFTTPKPAYQTTPAYYSNFYTTSGPSNFVTPSRPPSFGYHGFTTPRTTIGTSTPRPLGISSGYQSAAPVSSLGNYPRYTLENGVKYEHKIVWKYPDGRVSETAPTSYVNSYSEFNPKTRLTASANYQSGSYQSPQNYQGFSGPSAYSTGTQNTRLIPQYQSQQTYSSGKGPSNFPSEQRPVSNVYSHSPAQFPNDDEPPFGQTQSSFISSVSALNRGQSNAGFAEYGQKFKPSQRIPYPTSNDEIPKNYKTSSQITYENGKPMSKYAVNSPNAEYTYGTEPTRETTPSSLFTTSGQLATTVLSKYTPQAQNYLSKVFTSGSNGGKPGDAGNIPPSQYSDLLNYNPSISQYIKNPSSILNAQPTFVQAGNSLIPVIILRIDGAAPVEPKLTPNINLKALLQQYLSQYANSLQELEENSHYDLGEGSSKNSPNPLRDLTQLTHTLNQYSQNPHLTSGFQGIEPSSVGNERTSVYINGHRGGVGDFGRFKSPENAKSDNDSKYRKPQKVKSVQIIDDPRYNSFKANN